jgi:predicted ArsR family transcriptional regulator
MNLSYAEERTTLLLRQRRATTIRELTTNLTINRRTATKALDVLRRQGLVNCRTERREGGGRPLVRVYYLTPLGWECAPVVPHAEGQTRLGAVEA